MMAQWLVDVITVAYERAGYPAPAVTWHYIRMISSPLGIILKLLQEGCSGDVTLDSFNVTPEAQVSYSYDIVGICYWDDSDEVG